MVPESVANGDRILRDNAKKPLRVALHLIHPVPLRPPTTVINGSSYTIQSIFDTLTSIENKKLELCSAVVPGPGFDIWIRRGWRRPCRGSSYRRRRRCRPGSAPRRTPTSPSSSGAAPPPASGPAAPAPPAPFHKQKISPESLCYCLAGWKRSLDLDAWRLTLV